MPTQTSTSPVCVLFDFDIIPQYCDLGMDDHGHWVNKPERGVMVGNEDKPDKLHLVAVIVSFELR